ncbi:MAG: hypothetical protein ABIT37_05480, partial [Luteolibacter sp.]
ANRTIIICEGKDHALYNAACDDASRLFIPPGGSDNAAGVFAMARSNPGYLALRDRDFLMDTEIQAIKAELPNYRILPFYSIENLLYHPDNIASLEIPGFEPEGWKADILRWKEANPLLELKYERGKIQELRTVPTLRGAHEADPASIRQAYASPDFATCYRVIPMKRVPLDFLSSFNLTKDRLAKAPWFKSKIKEVTEP